MGATVPTFMLTIVLLVAGTGVRAEPVVIKESGDAYAEVVAVSLDGDATTYGCFWFPPLLSICGGGVSVANNGDADGALAVSTNQNAAGNVAVTVSGSAAGTVAVAGSGTAAGYVAVVGVGAASGLVAIAAVGQAVGTVAIVGHDGDATGWYALAGTGDAHSTGPTCVIIPEACVPGAAVSLTGDADGEVAISGAGQADGSRVQLSGCELGVPCS